MVVGVLLLVLIFACLLTIGGLNRRFTTVVSASGSSFTAGAIFLVTVPETIITSDWRGEGQGTTPKRSRS